MNHKDKAVYRAAFSGLTMTLFGRPQVLEGRYEVIVWQHTANPARWLGKIDSTTARGLWRGDSAEAVTAAVAQDFQEQLTAWESSTPAAKLPPRLSPAPRPVDGKRAG